MGMATTPHSEPFRTIEMRIADVEREVGLVSGPDNPLGQPRFDRLNCKIVDIDNHCKAALAKASSEIEILKQAFDKLKQRVDILSDFSAHHGKMLYTLMEPKRTLWDRLLDAWLEFKG